MKAHAKQLWAGGGTIFAATMLLIIGVFQVIVGIAAIGRDILFVTNTNYVYYLNTTAWGWIHLILGALLIVCGIGLYTRATWAMATGVFLAALAAIDNFFFLPFYPLWSLVIIALSVYVIWSLGTLLAQRTAMEAREGEAMAGGGRESRRDWAARDADTREVADREETATRGASEREVSAREAGTRDTAMHDTGRSSMRDTGGSMRDSGGSSMRDTGASGRDTGSSMRDSGTLDPGRHRRSST